LLFLISDKVTFMNIDVYHATPNPGLVTTLFILFGISAIGALVFCITITALIAFRAGAWAEKLVMISLSAFIGSAFIAFLVAGAFGLHGGKGFSDWVHDHYSYKISDNQAETLYSNGSIILDVDGTPKKITLETYKNGKILIMDGSALPQKEK
jgi:hypothetical protein